jgi:aryl-alcohol dehydrogenase-like predicted oxidoreductase
MGTDHLAQGDWVFNGQSEPSEEQIFAVLDEAARLGINFFDTAPIYVGGIENKLGKWLNSRRQSLSQESFYYNSDLNPDKKVYLLSKGGFPFDLYYAKKLEAGTHSEALKKVLRENQVLGANVSPAADRSLPLSNVPAGTYASRIYGDTAQITKRVSEEVGHTKANLGSDLVVYLMHRDDGDYFKFNEVKRDKMPVQSIMKALSDNKLSDQYALLGWSNWETDRVNQSVQVAASDASLRKPTFNSAYFSLFEMSSRSIHAGGVQVTHSDMMNPNFQKGVMQGPYSPLGGFSILDKPEPRWENAKRSAREKYDAGDAYWQNVFYSVFTEANEARFNRVESFTKKFNNEHNTSYTIDQMINAYALAHKRTDFLTVGPVTVEELRRTVGSLKLSRMLTEKDLEHLYSGR